MKRAVSNAGSQQMTEAANNVMQSVGSAMAGDAVSDAYVNDPKKGIQVHYGPKDANDKDKTVSITNTSDEELDAALKASGDDPFVKEVVDAIKHMREADEKSGNDIFKTLTESNRETHVVKENTYDDDKVDEQYDAKKRTIRWDPSATLYSTDKDNKPIHPKTDQSVSRAAWPISNQSSAVGLYHEMIHRTRHIKHPISMRIIRRNIPSRRWHNLEEKKVIGIENRATKLMDQEAIRVKYHVEPMKRK